MAAEEPPTKRPRADGASSAEASGGRLAVFIGEEGSLASVAAGRFFKHSPEIHLKGVASLDCAFKAVSSGDALYGVVPIENSASGTLHSTYDLLLQHDVLVGGELGVREIYCLCARQGVSCADVKYVVSHPNILAACSSFLETRIAAGVPGASQPLERLPSISTTEAAKRVSAPAESEFPSGPAAAIATKEAAVKHSLTVVAQDIGNDAFLETRYILFHSRDGKAAGLAPPFPRDVLSPIRKRSACFALKNEPASIFRLLSCWALRGIDVLKVETRPLASGLRAPPGLPTGIARLWDYLFYVDYAVPSGHTEAADARLWEALSEFSLWQRDFGSYPSQVTRVEKQAQTWSDMVDIMAKS